MKTLHEAICEVAGWQAYCERCLSKMSRIVQLGGSVSICPNPTCHPEEEIGDAAE